MKINNVQNVQMTSHRSPAFGMKVPRLVSQLIDDAGASVNTFLDFGNDNLEIVRIKTRTGPGHFFI